MYNTDEIVFDDLLLRMETRVIAEMFKLKPTHQRFKHLNN